MEKTPRNQKMTREERLREDIDIKKIGLRGAQRERGNTTRKLAAATEGSFIAGFRPRTAELEIFQKIQESLSEIDEIYASLERADDPKAEVRMLLEILIQRDDEWAETEGEFDARLLFFNMFQQQVSQKFLSGSEVLNYLRAHRTDDSFFESVIASLPAIKKKAESFGAYADKEAGYIKRSVATHSPHVTRLKAELPAEIEKAERQIERRTRHVARLSQILEEELKSKGQE